MKKVTTYCDLCKKEHHACEEVNLQAYDTLNDKLEMVVADVCYPCRKLFKEKFQITIHGTKPGFFDSNIPKWKDNNLSS